MTIIQVIIGLVITVILVLVALRRCLVVALDTVDLIDITTIRHVGVFVFLGVCEWDKIV